MSQFPFEGASFVQTVAEMKSDAKCFLLRIITIVLLLNCAFAENNSKLKDVLKNSYNRSGNRTDNNNSEDDFKSEIMKALEQCSSNSGNSDRNYRNSGKRSDQGRDFYKYMGNDDSGRGSSEYGYSGNSNYNRNRGSSYGSNQNDNSEVYSTTNTNYNEYHKHSGRGSNNQNGNSESYDGKAIFFRTKHVRWHT